MADGGNNSGVVAIFAIFIIVVVAAFFAWQGGVFGNGKRGADIEVNLPKASH
ncbi:MAG TPA: hypothetical protein VHE37_07740 [Nevskiaceae bacterium]|nr:hypothetical protein [Nevskiaceae bacterium]